MTPDKEKLIDELAHLLSDATGIPESDLRNRLIARAEYVVLPSSQVAIAKAEAKRQRKAAKLARQQEAIGPASDTLSK
jgi:mannitol/fructose-specific phosphotransferase system IIA component (Ntr-type)